MRKTTKLIKNKKKLNKDILCSDIGRLDIVMMSVLPNLVYKFNAIKIKIPSTYFMNIYKLTLVIVWRGKRPRIANTELKEKKKVKRMMLLNFKTHCKATSKLTVKPY